MSNKKMNLPNKLTLIRCAAVPVIIVLLMFSKYEWCDLAAALLFVAASFTDMLDGKIARKHNIVTDFGKLMDPLADKALVISVLVMLAAQSRIHAVPVIIIIVRELAVTSLRAIVAASKEQKVIAASVWGKWKTTIQMITIVMLILDNLMALVPFPITEIMVVAMTLLTIISGVEYFVQYKEHLLDY